MYSCSRCGASYDYADQAADCERQDDYSVLRDSGKSPEKAAKEISSSR